MENQDFRSTTGGGLLNENNSLKLKKFKEKNNKRKLIITVIILSILLLSGIYLYNSFAIFTEEKHFNVINGTVGDPGDIYFAYYVDGEITRNMPKQNTGYTLNVEKSNCTNGVVPKWDNAGWQFIGDYHNYSAKDYTRTRCNLYFEKTGQIVSTALGNIEVNSYTPDFSKSACDDETCESHEKGIYETLDDDGTSYYYRGSVENNYVKFAGYYWRIIRINGNGSIRMIYDGTVAHDNGETSDDRVYSKTYFNTSDSDNMHVGYMYTSGQVHGLVTNSNVKTVNDNFYSSKLTSYANYMDNNVGFCGDRSILNQQTGIGTARTTTYYTAYLRVTTNSPTFSCSLDADYYTVSNSSKGNKALSYPIGLITVDEAMYAGYSGGMFDGTYNYQKPLPDNFLNINYGYWTMTPAGFYNPYASYNLFASLFIIYEPGGFDDVHLGLNYGLRPVINLKSTLKFTGDGTKNNPYIPSL